VFEYGRDQFRGDGFQVDSKCFYLVLALIYRRLAGLRVAGLLIPGELDLVTPPASSIVIGEKEWVAWWYELLAIQAAGELPLPSIAAVGELTKLEADHRRTTKPIMQQWENQTSAKASAIGMLGDVCYDIAVNRQIPGVGMVSICVLPVRDIGPLAQGQTIILPLRWLADVDSEECRLTVLSLSRGLRA